jgi:hypothetical protein
MADLLNEGVHTIRTEVGGIACCLAWENLTEVGMDAPRGDILAPRGAGWRSSLLNLESVVLPPPPTAFKFHDGKSFGGELHRRRRSKVAHVRVAIEHVRLIFP